MEDEDGLNCLGFLCIEGGGTRYMKRHREKIFYCSHGLCLGRGEDPSPPEELLAPVEEIDALYI